MIDPRILSLHDGQILALTIIGEARGELIEGQVAVGCVIRNRVNKEYKTFAEVCLEPKQFSCWNEGEANYEYLKTLAIAWQQANPETPNFNQCLWVTRGIMDNQIDDNTYGALNYMTLKLYQTDRPTWARNVATSVVRGNQIFIRI